MLIWSSFLILHDETICWISKRTSRTSICSSDGGIDVQFWSWIQNFFMQKENLRNADWNQWFANLSLVKGKGYEILARTMSSRCVISSKAKRAKMHSLLHLSSVINAITSTKISGLYGLLHNILQIAGLPDQPNPTFEALAWYEIRPGQNHRTSVLASFWMEMAHL